MLVKSDAIGGLIECKRLVKCNANEWSVPMQSDGQVECNFAASANTVELAYNQVLALAGQVLNEVGKDKVLKQTQRYGAPALLPELADWAKKPEAIADGEIIEQVSKRMVAKQGTLIPRREYLAGILNKRLPNRKELGLIGRWRIA
uniref:hypothetical protein n=1 Tax=Pseudomonas sp. RA_105y_Pfl2_P56 TaxID=3088701 RepID=UPI0030DABC83